LVNFIKEVGFPIAVAAYVLVRLNGKMDRVVSALQELTRAIERQQAVQTAISEEHKRHSET